MEQFDLTATAPFESHLLLDLPHLAPTAAATIISRYGLPTVSG